MNGSSSWPIPDPVGPGEESVWSYPRPPRLEQAERRIRVELDGIVIADSTWALRVLETAHPPTYYVHPDDVDLVLLGPVAGGSWCEWKGRATYWAVETSTRRVEGGAWSYQAPCSSFAALADHFAFYPSLLDCFVDDERVSAQPGGFYGGWVTRDLAGPFKGGPGSTGW
jgi:uncharacterized protein (DUF427 family)